MIAQITEWFSVLIGILYKADPDTDLQKKRSADLKKKATLYQNSLYELKTQICKILAQK